MTLGTARLTVAYYSVQRLYAAEGDDVANITSSPAYKEVDQSYLSVLSNLIQGGSREATVTKLSSISSGEGSEALEINRQRISETMPSNLNPVGGGSYAALYASRPETSESLWSSTSNESNQAFWPHPTSKQNHHQCTVCGKVFAMQYYFRRHMMCHEEKRFQCPYCSIKVSYKWNLKAHILKVHKDKQPFP